MLQSFLQAASISGAKFEVPPSGSKEIASRPSSKTRIYFSNREMNTFTTHNQSDLICMMLDIPEPVTNHIGRQWRNRLSTVWSKFGPRLHSKGANSFYSGSYVSKMNCKACQCKGYQKPMFKCELYRVHHMHHAVLLLHHCAPFVTAIGLFFSIFKSVSVIRYGFLEVNLPWTASHVNLQHHSNPGLSCGWSPSDAKDRTWRKRHDKTQARGHCKTWQDTSMRPLQVCKLTLISY